VIWHKPAPMPSSVTDRCTTAHEYLFLFAKSERYFYDSEAVKENVGQIRVRKATTNEKLEARTRAGSALCASDTENRGFGRDIVTNGRNRRSVWTVTTKPYKGRPLRHLPA
jgi:site-specific DNA-methyltransferase (cytosine-N4-specific)